MRKRPSRGSPRRSGSKPKPTVSQTVQEVVPEPTESADASTVVEVEPVDSNASSSSPIFTVFLNIVRVVFAVCLILSTVALGLLIYLLVSRFGYRFSITSLSNDSQSLAPLCTLSDFTSLPDAPYPVADIVVSRTGRMFLSLEHEAFSFSPLSSSTPSPPQLLEFSLTPSPTYTPFPPIEDQRSLFHSVRALCLDEGEHRDRDRNRSKEGDRDGKDRDGETVEQNNNNNSDRLWVLDHADFASEHRPQLLALSLSSSSPVLVHYVFPDEVAPPGSFFVSLALYRESHKEEDMVTVFILDASLLLRRPRILSVQCSMSVSTCQLTDASLSFSPSFSASLSSLPSLSPSSLLFPHPPQTQTLGTLRIMGNMALHGVHFRSLSLLSLSSSEGNKRVLLLTASAQSQSLGSWVLRLPSDRETNAEIVKDTDSEHGDTATENAQADTTDKEKEQWLHRREKLFFEQTSREREKRHPWQRVNYTLSSLFLHTGQTLTPSGSLLQGRRGWNDSVFSLSSLSLSSSSPSVNEEDIVLLTIPQTSPDSGSVVAYATSSSLYLVTGQQVFYRALSPSLSSPSSLSVSLSSLTPSTESCAIALQRLALAPEEVRTILEREQRKEREWARHIEGLKLL